MAIKIGCDCFIADSAVIIGNVTVGDRVAIMDNAVIRGDQSEITVGNDTNIQDNVTIHCDEGRSTNIGDHVSVGHNAIVHGCEIEDYVLVGMGSMIMNGAHVSFGSVIGAGALVTEGFKCEPKSLVLGVPAKVLRSGDEKLMGYATANASSYDELRKDYISGKFERLYGRDIGKK